MITKRQFEKYKQFRYQSYCMFCVLEEPNGLYWVMLDSNNDALVEAHRRQIIKDCKKEHFKTREEKVDFISKALENLQPDKYAYHCEDCGAYWINGVCNDLFHTAKYPVPSNDITPDEAVVLIAKKAAAYFMSKYGNSAEFIRLVTQYSEYRVHADVTIRSGGERSREIEIPLVECSSALNDFLFESFKESLLNRFYGREFLQRRIEEMYNGEEELNLRGFQFIEELLTKNGFLGIFIKLLKDSYAGFVKQFYPLEAGYFLDGGKVEPGLENELYGRCIAKIFDNMLGLSISDSDKDNIIHEIINYGDWRSLSKNQVLEIIHTIVFKTVKVDIQ